MNRLIKLAGLALLLPLMAVDVQAVTSSSKTLQLITGENAKVSLAGISGTVTVSSSNSAVAVASLASRTVSVTASAPGSAILSVKDSKGTATITVTVKAPMSVTPASLSLAVGGSATITISNPYGSVRFGNSDTSKVMAFLQNNVVTVTGRTVGQATLTIRDNKISKTVVVQVTAAQTGATVKGTTEGRLLASNCFQCHGTYGSGGFDKLLRKSEAELLEELNGFAQGKEGANGIMAAHARGYTPEQLKAIAKFLANP